MRHVLPAAAGHATYTLALRPKYTHKRRASHRECAAHRRSNQTAKNALESHRLPRNPDAAGGMQ